MKNCPVCTTVLAVTVRQGVEIDHCPRCRGVWLDRGELDKLIEWSAPHVGHDRDDDDSDWGGDRRPHGGDRAADSGHYPAGGYPTAGHAPPKKKGFFGRMFDFD